MASLLGLRGGHVVGDNHCYGNDEANNRSYVMAGLQQDKMPKHVAKILDGNRRWLKAHGKALTYEPFFQSNMLFADLCLKWGVASASLPQATVIHLKICNEARKGVKVFVIGERTLLPESLLDKVQQVENTTINCTKLELTLAVCYTGTRDIVQATRTLCKKVTIGLINVDAIDERLFEQELWTKASRALAFDLLIRTGGCHYISDYLMWQLVYAQLYFTDICAPEFSEV